MRQFCGKTEKKKISDARVSFTAFPSLLNSHFPYSIESEGFNSSSLALPRTVSLLDLADISSIPMGNKEDNRHEEVSPLIPQAHGGEKKAAQYTSFSNTPAIPEAMPPMKSSPLESSIGNGYGWTADGLPLGRGSVVGEPMGRYRWNSSICACLGRNDEFCSSDIEVCLLGSLAPCVLYGSNVERLGSAPGTFANHCLPYSGLYAIGNSCFGCNYLAPWFSYPSRTAIRRKFNLEGSCEALNRSCGCCGSFLEDEVQREQCESACDLATHVFCHTCALCQEGRELRRRLPHPGFNAQPILVMIPPAEQTMGRGA